MILSSSQAFKQVGSINYITFQELLSNSLKMNTEIK